MNRMLPLTAAQERLSDMYAVKEEGNVQWMKIVPTPQVLGWDHYIQVFPGSV